ncbi:DUF2716 domain-containing protein [Streptomyces sp. NPDC058378]|uniref:DUF2716 domain-containing protein n=1 Tax=Streptomyces sp. NPDC058378 TaxID=3346469 RepID=UPI003660D1B7
MSDEVVAELEDTEYRRVWDRFYEEFRFRPSVYPAHWPAITEPVDSATWSLRSLPDDPEYVRLDRLVEIVKQGLASSIGPHGRLFALDWQHPAYQFSPHDVGGPEQPDWPLSPYPDGDYFIFLSEDFRVGTFGHPWEESLCLFGQQLLDVVSTGVEQILGAPVRRSRRRLPSL